MKDKLQFVVSKPGKHNVIRVDHTIKSKDWEQYYLLRSDAHHDNPDCRWDLELEHLKEAKERKAGVLDFGDLFCAMQGKYDKRSDKSKVRPEHQAGDYLDTLISTAADFYEPYGHLWVMQGIGNHETAIRKNHETDLTERFAQVMRDRTGALFPITGYTGWVGFRFKVYSSNQKKVLWHTHGYGGGGPVTKDMIQRARQLVYVGNADIMVSGHTHDQWVTKDIRMKLNSHDRIERHSVRYVKCPTYKDEYKTGEGGWPIEKGHPPKPLGAYWLRFFLGREKTDDKSGKYVIKMEIREAIV